MKYLIAFLLLSFMAIAGNAAAPVFESPIYNYGTPVTVSIDNSTLTKVPTSQTSGRNGIFLAIPSANTGDIVGFIGNCTSTGLANTIRPLKFTKSTNSVYIPIREDICLWLVTTNGSPESISYQEAIQ